MSCHFHYDFLKGTPQLRALVGGFASSTSKSVGATIASGKDRA
jgi:hypothetical protein